MGSVYVLNPNRPGPFRSTHESTLLRSMIGLLQPMVTVNWCGGSRKTRKSFKDYVVLSWIWRL